MRRFYNRTRRSRSIPRRLIRERKPYLLPIYYLMLTSELANEGIHNSGSPRFADHVYASAAAGRFGVGKALDAVLLRLPSARAMRSRYKYAKAEIYNLLRERIDEPGPTSVLAVPSGLARELFEVADELRASGDPSYWRIRWYGLDLDEDLVLELRRRAGESGHPMCFLVGDALSIDDWGAEDGRDDRYDMIISMGFTEFLEDALVAKFYRLARVRLAPGGVFVTSGMLPHRVSDYLLRNIGELYTHYRSEDRLLALAEEAGFRSVRIYHDPTGLQTMLIARKERE